MSPQVSAELFVIPNDGSYIICASLRQAAFVANAATLNQLADLQQGRLDDVSEDLIEFLRQLESNERPRLGAIRGQHCQ